jgi:hypothetical protein
MDSLVPRQKTLVDDHLVDLFDVGTCAGPAPEGDAEPHRAGICWTPVASTHTDRRLVRINVSAIARSAAPIPMRAR